MSTESPYTQAQTLVNLAATLFQAGQPSEAQSAWQKAEKIARTTGYDWQHTKISRQISKVLAQAGQWQEAERVVASIKDASWRVRASRGIAKILVKTGQWQEAERLTLAIPDATFRTVALRCLARDLAKYHQWQEAERITSFITDAANQAIAFHNIAAILVQAKQEQQAQNIRQKAASIVTTLFDDSPQTYTLSFEILNDLIAALIKDHQWQEAERVISLIKPDWARVHMLDILVAALAKRKQY